MQLIIITDLIDEGSYIHLKYIHLCAPSQALNVILTNNVFAANWLEIQHRLGVVVRAHHVRDQLADQRTTLRNNSQQTNKRW